LDNIVNLYTIICIISSIIMILCALSFIGSYNYQYLVVPLFIISAINLMSVLFVCYFTKVFIEMYKNIKEINQKMK
jgi:uncharacterized membrane protein YozB (DUF420 family)